MTRKNRHVWIVASAVALLLAACGGRQDEVSSQRLALDVTWQNVVGVSAVGSNLTKTSSTADWDAGASSIQSITGDGYIEFTTGENDTYKMAGLSNADADASYTTIDFAIYLAADGWVYIFESGTSRGSFGPYAAGDVFRVRVADGVVTYYKDGVLLYTSAVAPTLPLLVDTSLYSPGATIQSVSITSTIWQNQVGVLETEDSLTKTAATFAWDAGASTLESIAGNGHVEFTTAENDTYKMVGLSHTDADADYTTIDFAIYLAADGWVYIFESGVSRGSFGPYAAGDVFRVGVTDGAVTYYRNGTSMYESSVPPTSPLVVDTSLYSPGATIQNVVLSTSPWQNMVGVFETGNSLEKTAATSAWDAGASTSTGFSSDGYVEFTTGENDTYKMAGLSHIDADTDYATIDFAIYMAADGWVYIYESGTSRGPFATYAAGDVFRVMAVNGVVTYHQNGALLYTSAVTPTMPLMGDTSLYSPGATIQDVVITSTVWQNQVGVSAVDNSLKKSSPTQAWDAGASTLRSFKGNGYFEFTTAENNTYKMAGLSDVDADVDYATIDFAFYLAADGWVYIFESGTARGSFGSYAPGDVFRVEVEGGVVNYYQNSALLYTSAVTPASPLMGDTSLYSPGATINDVILKNRP